MCWLVRPVRKCSHKNIAVSVLCPMILRTICVHVRSSGCWWLCAHHQRFAQYENTRWRWRRRWAAAAVMVGGVGVGGVFVGDGDGDYNNCGTWLVKTTTQICGLPHAKAKVKFFLLYGKQNIDGNYKGAHTLLFDSFCQIICNILLSARASGVWNSDKRYELQLTGFQTLDNKFNKHDALLCMPPWTGFDTW